MDRERKTVLLVVGLIAFCFTVLAVLVFASLWPDRVVVAWVLLAVFGVLALTLVAGKINEMTLRRSRYHHHYETPLDEDGRPLFLPVGAERYEPVPQPRDGYR